MTNSQLFDLHVPVQLQKNLSTLVFESCKSASEHCYDSFSSRRVAKDVSGHYRRGRIEDQWEGILALFPNQVFVDQQWFKHGTGSYCELACGIVRLTQSCVQVRGEIPRQAEFRLGLATNGQYSMFEPQEPEIKPQYLYSILTYAIDSEAKNREQPAFIKIEFPNATCTAPVDAGIDLVKRYPEIAIRYLSRPSFDAAVTERERKRRKIA